MGATRRQKSRSAPAAFLALGLTTVTFLAGAVAHAGPITTAYSTEEVSPDIHVVHGPLAFPNPINQGFMNNPGFIVTGEGVVVIDPGSSVHVGRMVLKKIREVTELPVVASFSTHVHGDHWLGNQAISEAFPEATLYGHPALIEEANAGSAQNWIGIMLQLTEGATEGTTAVIPDTPVDHGDSITVGGYTFDIHHHGPAHTNTDIAVHVSPGDVLFTGDLAFNGRVGRIDDGKFKGLDETLGHLLALEPALVVPGHGATGDTQILENMRRLHARLYATVEALYEDDLSDFEMKPRVVEVLKEFESWSGFEDEVGRMVSHAYLQVEEESF